MFLRLLLGSGASDGCSLTLMTVIKTGASANNPVGVPPSTTRRMTLKSLINSKFNIATVDSFACNV